MNPHQNVNTNNSSSSIGAMEAKLHSVAATFRRERDEAHRREELAEERLRLAKEDAEAARLSTAALKEKLDDLESKSGATAQNEIEQLQKDVRLLTAQVEFQHMELLQMREKKQGLIQKHAADTTKRSQTLTRLSAGVTPQREKVFADASVAQEMKPDPERLLAELEGDVDNSLYSRWAIVIKAKAESIQDMTKQQEVAVKELRRVAQGYQTKFGFLAETE